MRRSSLACLTLCLFACGGQESAPATAERVADPEPTAVETPNAESIGVAEPDVEGPDASPVPAPPPVIGIDTHVDTTQRMLDDSDDIADRLEGGHLDLPRMREGGLGGAFFSIWVHPRRHPGEEAWTRSLALIEAVRRVATEHADQAALCTTAAEVRAAAAAGNIALLMGVEGGHSLGTAEPELALERLRRFYELGVRYMTITWSTDNPLGHSSTGSHRSRGLTELGREVVREMNRLGMIVDVSHVSDQTFSDIMDITTKPVFASHSSARALANHPRNMTDAMIRRVAEGGGAICVNYYSKYIDVGYRDRLRALESEHEARFEALRETHENWIARGGAARDLARELDPDVNPPGIRVLGAHFAHIAEVGGPGAVCLGSDFDGVPELPIGLRDVSELGNLRAELERRGLDIPATYDGNVLRVLAAQSGD